MEQSASNAQVQKTVAHLIQANQLDQAIIVLRRALLQWPDSANFLNLSGILESKQGSFAKAIDAFTRAAELEPTSVMIQMNLGNALRKQGQPQKALEVYETAKLVGGENRQLQINIANALLDLGRESEAVPILETALKQAPDNSKILNNLGMAYSQIGREREAVQLLENALRQSPQDAKILNNLGKAYLKSKDIKSAVNCFERAVTIAPNYDVALKNLAFVFADNLVEIEGGDRLDLLGSTSNTFASIDLKTVVIHERISSQQLAIALFRKALALNENDPDSLAGLQQVLRACCIWNMEQPNFFKGKMNGDIRPFPALTLIDDPGIQREISDAWAKEHFRFVKEPVRAPKAPNTQGKLRVGILCSEFREHPMMYVSSKFLEIFDREKIETFAYSLTLAEGDPWRERVRSAVERFEDVGSLDDRTLVRRLTEDKLDILLDWNGYSSEERANVLQYRPAPVQISHLAYPSTMGTSFIDYLVADPILIPPEERQHYSEKIIYLPHTYMPTDNSRRIGEPKTRQDYGLPEDGFVFCCFNKVDKIGPAEFEIWTRLLKKVPDSVLWLSKTRDEAKVNLYREASERGLDPNRLIFATRVEESEHLARHLHADLFIDTFNYNAHSTAADALFAGLPLVTKCGRQFAARVAASVLSAVGMEELITYSKMDYQNLILKLATNRDQLFEIREKLARNVGTQPLFDTNLYTRNFEKALFAVHKQHLSGAGFTDIRIG